MDNIQNCDSYKEEMNNARRKDREGEKTRKK
jgi:hypothetical protein